MEPQANPPLGQPISSDSTNPPVVPQPLQNEAGPKQPSKRLIVILGAVGVLVVLASVFWLLAQNAKKEYTQASVAYRVGVKMTRDAMNKELNSKDIRASSAEAKTVFESYGKKLQTTQAPQAPKVLGFIPAGGEYPQTAALQKATEDYANALRTDFAIFTYYTDVTEDFKPIKDLGTITFLHRDKVMSLAEYWPTFNDSLQKVKPPQKMISMHADLLKQTADIETKIASLAKSFDTNSDTTNDKLLGELTPLTTKFTKTFNDAVLDEAGKTFDAVNDTYDRLDEQLKK
jgi:hypothetical protein